ncbi:aminodeoxychorismate lyase [Thorsellia kenyensis]|uniref:Aminodeoxychorismate lyase n=1 Tax=Thorsellia kenyensis TaxID=1549888 RepID=A0ABV6CC99_9GAMM
MLMMINGEPSSQINALDRGLSYGDGCFTTALVYHQKIIYFDHHIARLHNDTERLYFPDISWDMLSEKILEESYYLIHKAKGTPIETQGVLKIILTRGEGTRGYSPLGCQNINRIITLSHYPTQYVDWQKIGIDVGISSINLAHQPLLAGIKHLNRLEQVLIKRELSLSSYDDMIVLDQEKNIIEASAANIFWRKGDIIFTPDITQAGINGLMRNRVISLLQASGFCELKIVKEPTTTLQEADEIMLSSALMPLIPIKRLYVSDTQYWDYSPLKREAWPYLFTQLLEGK